MSIFSIVIKRIVKSSEFKKMLYREMYKYITKEPKVIGDNNRLIISDKAYKNNFFANTNSGIIEIKDYVFFGKNVSLITGTHNYNVFNQSRVDDYPIEGRDIIIEEGCWIASNSIIIGPTVIGKHSVVAAGSVVVDNVEPYTIVGGNPAKVIKKIEKIEG